jgi:hypothetical protein
VKAPSLLKLDSMLAESVKYLLPAAEQLYGILFENSDSVEDQAFLAAFKPKYQREIAPFWVAEKHSQGILQRVSGDRPEWGHKKKTICSVWHPTQRD